MEMGGNKNELDNQHELTTLSNLLWKNHNLLLNFIEEPLNQFVTRSLDLGRSDGSLISLIYLHYENVIYSNIFVNQILSKSTITDFLGESFQLWGCNMTDESQLTEFRFWRAFQYIFRRVPPLKPKDKMFPMLIGVRLSSLNELLEFEVPYSYTILLQGSNLLISNEICSIEIFKNDLDLFKANVLSVAAKRKKFFAFLSYELLKNPLINELSNKGLNKLVSQYSTAAIIWMKEKNIPLYLKDLSGSQDWKARKYFQSKNIKNARINFAGVCDRHRLCDCEEGISNLQARPVDTDGQIRFSNLSFSSSPQLEELMIVIDKQVNSDLIYHLMRQLPASVTNLHVRCSDFMCDHYLLFSLERSTRNRSIKNFIFDFENLPIPLTVNCHQRTGPCFLKMCVSLLTSMRELRKFRLIIHKCYFEEIIQGIKQFQEIIEQCSKLNEISIQINEEMNETEVELISDIQRELNTIRPIVFEVVPR